MKRKDEQANISEKRRIRDEIDEQIRAYLQQGGKIDVLTANERGTRNAIGSVWHGSDDIPGIGQ